MRKNWWKGCLLLSLGLLGGGLWVLLRPAPLTMSGILIVNGRIEGDQAAVGAQASGKIVRLTVREGDHIAAGDLIAELASEQVEAQVEQATHTVHTRREQFAGAQARVATVQSQVQEAETAVQVATQESQAWIGEARAALAAAQARLRQTEAEYEKADKDAARFQELFTKKVIAAQQLDAAQAAAAGARAAMEAAQGQVMQAEKTLERAQASRLNVELRQQGVVTAQQRLAEAHAAVETARAQVQTAAASRQLAEANLHDTRVVAPFRGTVLHKLVEPGEVVAAGTPLITLIDLSHLYAKVYIAEKDLGKTKIGDPARVYTDAFPGHYFAASVAQIAQQAEFTPRDVHMQDERVKLVFSLKLAITNPQEILKPGMPVDARIRWQPAAPWGDGME